MKKTEQQTKIIEEAETAAYQIKNDLSSMQCLVFASIISADNDKYTEEQKQEVISRYDKDKGLNQDWKYVLEPVDSTGKLAKLFEL